MIQVTEVTTPKDKKVFIKFPWTVYKDDPHWVPPLLMDMKKMFNEKKHPFYEYGEMKLYLARKEGQVVGRIAAIKNPLYNEHHDPNTGFFGFFECFDDQAVANALFDKAGEQLKAWGYTFIHGPANPSSNYEYGLLIDGFNDSPRVMMSYNPEYYVKLVENYGFENLKNLLAYKVPGEDADRSAKMKRVVDAVTRRYNVTLRHIDFKRLDEEVALIKEIYNECWEPNWGHIPMTEAEFNDMAAGLKQFADAEFLTFVYCDGEVAGLSMTLRDMNFVTKQMNGKIFPFGWTKLFTQKKHIKWARVLILGVLPKFQKKGLDAVLYSEILRVGLKLGCKYAEGSWILEDNPMMNRGLQAINGEVYKTYAAFGKDI